MSSAFSLFELLSRVPRRYERTSTLHERVNGAQPLSPAGELAVVIEQARVQHASGSAVSDALQRRFCTALLRLIQDALRRDGGDPAYQGQVLRRRQVSVEQYAQHCDTLERDRRAWRTAVDAIAHPGKWRTQVQPSLAAAMHALHVAARAEDLQSSDHALTAAVMAAQSLGEQALHDRLSALRTLDAYRRLQTLDALLEAPDVQTYRDLTRRQGPFAGSPEAAEHGHAAGRRGASTENATADAVLQLAAWLEADESAPGRYRVVRGLLIPAAFPGPAEGSKSEFDVVLLRLCADRPVANGEAPVWDLVWLLEAKAAIEAVAPDVPGLMRGLERLAQAPGPAVEFPSQNGPVWLSTRSLQALRPVGDLLPPPVLYSCDGAVDTDDAPVPALAPQHRMRLLTEADCLDAATRLAGGEPVSPDALRAVWSRLFSAPRLAPVLRFWPLEQQARAVTVHPDDLLAAFPHPAVGASGTLPASSET